MNIETICSENICSFIGNRLYVCKENLFQEEYDYLISVIITTPLGEVLPTTIKTCIGYI